MNSFYLYSKYFFCAGRTWKEWIEHRDFLYMFNFIPATFRCKKKGFGPAVFSFVTACISSSYCLSVLAGRCPFFNLGICREHISAINLCLQQKAADREKLWGVLRFLRSVEAHKVCDFFQGTVVSLSPSAYVENVSVTMMDCEFTRISNT